MKPSIIPLPEKMEYTGGSSVINDNSDIVKLIDKTIKSEGYRLQIKDDKVYISYSDEAGLFYALQTLTQVKETCGVVCNNLLIEDSPAFSHRGFSLDCCRHFFSVEEVKKIIDVAALYKFNVFHWHLTDDQGWRLPSEKYPLLNVIGCSRKNSTFGGVIEEGEYSYFYTKSEIFEIVNYCRERFIEVIPEVDMPGHTTSVLASYNNLGCTGEKVELTTKEGIFDTVLCLGNPDSVKFAKNIIDEVCDLFPGKYIHIGGDEAPRTKWKNCPKCKEKMKELDITDYDEYQGYFIKEIALYIKAKGKTAITWNESLKGNIPGANDVIVQRWMDRKNLSYEFANNGGKIIETDFYHYYCDYPYGMTPVGKTYKYHPISKKLNNKSSVIGIEAEMWTEYIRNFDDLCEKFFPRFMAVAERSWCGDKNYNYNDFVQRQEKLRNLTESYGITIIPKEKWDIKPSKRLADILNHFKGSLNIELIKDAFDNQ